MAFSKPLALLLLLLLVVALAATAMRAAGQAAPCIGERNVTVQNLCGHDLNIQLEPLANSQALLNNAFVLRHGHHETFSKLCSWTGRIKTAEAPVTEFHVGGGADKGAWYQVSIDQARYPIRVSITPHGHPLRDHCPTAGCSSGGHCFADSVAGGKCHGVDEIKVVYYNHY